uniref:Ufd2P_core domain-containing protein n=1 Tax=Strongyloides venezuelensis TaxID=75913 RepID=A0A0K0FIT4_STRVS
MEEYSVQDISYVLSTQYYNDFINNPKFCEIYNLNQIIDHFNVATKIIIKFKNRLDITFDHFQGLGLYICKVLECQMNKLLKATILEFYYTLYENISQERSLVINDNNILECLFSHFVTLAFESNSKQNIEENHYISDSKVRIYAFKICSKSINRNNINLIFNSPTYFINIINLFHEKSTFFFYFLIHPNECLKSEEEISSIFNVSINMLDTLEAYFNLLTSYDNACFDNNIKTEAVERMKESVNIMLTTILGDSIHQIFDSPDYTDQIKRNLYKIISFILKFSMLITKDDHILLFKESFQNVTRILLKLCLIEGIPSPCFDKTYFTDYRSQLLHMKSILLSLQSKFSFLLLTEQTYFNNKNDDNAENDIVNNFKTLEI